MNFTESIFKKYSGFQNQGVQFIVPLPFPKNIMNIEFKTKKLLIIVPHP